MENEIVLGCIARDVVTGYIGTVVAYVEYINGCKQFRIVPCMAEGESKYPGGEYIDVERLEYVSPGVSKKFGSVKPSGGGIRHKPKGAFI